MAYLAFYRMFRPTKLEEVVRQENVVKILKNQIDTGKIGHAYLFCGPRGTGKTTIAKIFARSINCESPVDGSPCGKCPTCLKIESGGNLDISEIDAASNNGVDEIRELRDKVQYPPVVGKYKVYIIDEVHMLSPQAFNAFLKTLEEPPAHSVFILATTEPQKIPATILSRCMRFDFKLIPQADLEGLIKRTFDKVGKEYEEEAVSAIARAGAGSARDSLSIADMCASYATGKLTYDDVNAVLGSADFYSVADILEHIFKEDSASSLSSVENALSTGKGVGVLLRDLLNLLNNCAIVKMCKNGREIVNVPQEMYERIASLARMADGHRVLRCTEILAKAEADMRYALNGRILLETAVIKCSMLQADYNIDALIARIATIEKKLHEGIKIVSVESQSPQSGQSSTQVVSTPKRVEDEGLTPPPEEDWMPYMPQPIVEEAMEEEQPTQTQIDESQLTEEDKSKVFGNLLRALRTTYKNAVVFTLCMDAITFFEGGLFIISTDSEVVYKGLTRQDNKQFLDEVLCSLGVKQHEVRLIQKGENALERGLSELKRTFGDDLKIKP